MREQFLPIMVLAMVCLASASVSAQEVKYPPDFPKPPETSGMAAGWFSPRAEAVVAFNACAREVEYLRIRAAMARGDYHDQGENLTSILIAKIAWLNYRTAPCTAAIPATAEDFFGIWAASTTRCAVETNLSTDVRPQVLTVSVSTDCMRRQINESIMAMVKISRLGTDKLPCGQTLQGILGIHDAISGDWDVNVRELVRILYMAGPGAGDGQSLLDPNTVDHMYEHLLAARGALGPSSYSVVAGCDEEAGEELGSPEDTADRHTWYNELLSGIGDLFDWFFETNFKFAVMTIAAASVPAFALVAAGEDQFIPPFDVRVPETENHRLMIETSRYLTNADIIARLESKGYDSDLIDDIKDDQREVREWLLRRLQDITKNDFIEYNARPYTRYSLEAISNLYEFAGVHDDNQLRTAAGIVLDLSAAKFALGSNRGRRIAPFRRLSGNDGSNPGSTQDLYNYAEGGDHEVARAIVLAGQTQLLPDGWMGEKGGGGVLVNTAVSTYRLPVAVGEVMVDRQKPLFQHIRNAGVEAYFQSPAFTVSAGGLRTGPAYTVLGHSEPEDHGVAMPTVIIPTIGGTRIQDLFGFNGVGTHHERTDNLCVWFGFACGMQPQLSELFSVCESNKSAVGATTNVFVNSANCPRFAFTIDSQFFLAVRFVECDGSFCTPPHVWGLMEIVEAPKPGVGPAERAARDSVYATFRAGRLGAFDAAMPDGEGHGTYVTATGDQIAYVINETQPIVTAVNGVAQSYLETAGDVINANGLGVATITGASGAKVAIDFSDWSDPKRWP